MGGAASIGRRPRRWGRGPTLGLGLAWARGACGGDGVAPGGGDPATRDPHASGLAVEPIALWNAESEFTVALRVAGEGLTGLRAVRLQLWLPLPDQAVLDGGVAATTIELRDDGAAGDDVAGDGTFSRGGLRVSTGSGRPTQEIPVVVEAIDYVFDDAVLSRPFEPGERLLIALYALARGRVPEAPVQDLGGGLRRTDHVIAAVLPPGEPFPAAHTQTGELMDWWRAHTTWDPDVVYFIELYPNREGLGAAHFSYVWNQIEGLGLPAQGEPTERYWGVMRSGEPGAASLRIWIHEWLHKWAVYADPSLGIKDLDGAHWSDNLARETTGFVGDPYNDLELYLMGLIPADSVEAPITDDGWTIEDWVRVMGERRPAWPNTQRAFTMAHMVYHERPLTDLEMALFDYLAAEWGKPSTTIRNGEALTFEQATGGRATMDTRIPDDAFRP